MADSQLADCTFNLEELSKSFLLDVSDSVIKSYTKRSSDSGCWCQIVTEYIFASLLNVLVYRL